MLPASAALVMVVLAAGLGVLTTRSLRGTQAAVRDLHAAVLRQRAWSAEADRFVAARTRIADVTTGTADAVQLGSAITQTGHRVIAAIPFGILGLIPGTRHPSRRARAVHDGTADLVYDGIATVADRVGTALRTWLVGPD